MGKCLRSPGLCPKLLSTLKQMAPTLTELERLVTISIDGMKIKPVLRYEKHLDRICGFEDCGAVAGGRTDKVANELEAMWLSGLHGQYKQPIAYYLVQGCSGRDRFRLMISDCVKASNSSGFSVKVLVCDQQLSQWASLKAAGV